MKLQMSIKIAILVAIYIAGVNGKKSFQQFKKREKDTDLCLRDIVVLSLNRFQYNHMNYVLKNDLPSLILHALKT